MSESTLSANPVKRKLAAGELVLCMALRQARTPDAAQIVQACGFDAFYIDQEHSTITSETTSAICTMGLSLGVVPLVRVASNSAQHVGQALDGGALGVIAPHIDTAADAAALVRHAKYPPLGTRSVASVGPATRYRQGAIDALVREQNEATLVIAMLETATAISSAGEIAAVPGIDMLLVGALDLAFDMGLGGETQHLRVRAACEQVFAACTAHGKHYAVSSAAQGLQAEMIARGARFISAGMDVNYLMSAARADAARLRALKQ